MNAILRGRALPVLPASLVAGALLALSAWTIPALALDDSKAHPAGAPVAEQAGIVNARELGLADAVLEYCTKADPTSVDAVKARVNRVTHGASPRELAKVREGSGYVGARRAEADFLGKVDPRNAARICGGKKALPPVPHNAKAK
jgi:hypothetical protein